MLTPTRLSPLFALLLLFSGSLVLAACGDDPEPAGPPPEFEFPLEVHVTDPADSPIAGVPVVLDGNVVAFTDREGRFEGTIFAVPGTEIEFGIQETGAYRLRDEGTNYHQLSISQGIDGLYRGNRVAHRAELISVTNEYFAWLEITCDEHLDDKHCRDLPILMNDEEVSRTDHRGVAQFSFTGVPDQDVTFRIQTPNFGPDDDVMMEPRRQEFQFTLGYDPTIYRGSAEFTDPAARRASEQRRRYRPRPRPRPTTTTESEPEPEPEPEPEEPSGPPSFF